MNSDILMSITPRDVHSLWLLTQHLEVLGLATVKLLLESSEGITLEVLQRQLSFGQELGFIEKFKQDKYQLTFTGKKFAQKAHWRFWDASSCYLNRGHISKWFDSEYTYYNRPTIIDLFSGAGGLGLGFEVAGFRVGIAVDEDKQACEAHQLNFPFSKTIHDDVNKLAHDKFAFFMEHELDQDMEIDGIIGGPPCQGFSYVGERAENDDRNLLTSKFIDVVLDIRPKFFVLENVRGLLTSGMVPEFSKYIIRQSKTNSLSVSQIVDMLPASNAKRDRQFRRRLVSSCVKLVQSSLQLEESFVLNNTNVIRLITDVYNRLLENLTLSIGDELPSRPSNIENLSSNSLATIAVGSVVAHLIDKNYLKPKCVQVWIQGLLKEEDLSSHVRRTLLLLLDKYVKAPRKGIFGGVEVGPVLLNLIKRVSSEYIVVPPKILNAADFGTPQDRERLFIVGIRRDLGISFTFPEPTHMTDSKVDCNKVLSASDAIHDLPNVDLLEQTQSSHQFDCQQLKKAQTRFVEQARLESTDLSSNFSLCRPSWNPYIVDCSERVFHRSDVIERMSQLAEGAQDTISRRTRLDRAKPSPTLRAGTKEKKGSHTAVRPIHYEHSRVITVREGARLMGYPDWMTFHKTKWHGFRLVGNGVPLPLSNAIAKRIMELLYG